MFVCCEWVFVSTYVCKGVCVYRNLNNYRLAARAHHQEQHTEHQPKTRTDVIALWLETSDLQHRVRPALPSSLSFLPFVNLITFHSFYLIFCSFSFFSYSILNVENSFTFICCCCCPSINPSPSVLFQAQP